MINKLVKILKLTQLELKNYLQIELKKYYKEDKIYVEDGGIVVFGDLNITLIAHMDIKNENPPEEVYIEEGRVHANGQILGGDDRCGISIILQLLNEGYRPNIIFTEDEEIGSIGIKKLMSNGKLIDKIVLMSAYLLQLDRKNSNDYVMYDCDNYLLDAHMTNFGYEKKRGSSTDIKHISNHYNIASVNISVGYYDEHTENEYVVIDEFVNAYQLVKKQLENIPNQHLENYNFNEAYSY